MPIFDYYCEDCGRDQLDVLVRDADEPIICLECGKPMLKRPPHINFSMTPLAITRTKRSMGNTVPPEYKTSGGANIYGVPRRT